MSDPPHLGLGLAPQPGTDIQDVYLSDKGNLVFAIGARAVAEHVRQRLMTYQGEWFLDIDAGVPWLEEIMGGRYNPGLAEAVVKAEILDTPAIREITEFSIGFDRRQRHLVIRNVVVLTEYDTEVSI